MNEQGKERRQFKRYNTDVEIYFDFIYDLETKVEFTVINEDGHKEPPKKHSAYSRNVSVGGLCFSTTKRVDQGDLLYMELYIPGADKPVPMKGKVEWCKPATRSYADRLHEEVEGQRVYEVGVRLMTVDDQRVEETIHRDVDYDVDWSVVLESVFGNYRLLMEGKNKDKDK